MKRKDREAAPPKYSWPALEEWWRSLQNGSVDEVMMEEEVERTRSAATARSRAADCLARKLLKEVGGSLSKGQRTAPERERGELSSSPAWDWKAGVKEWLEAHKNL